MDSVVERTVDSLFEDEVLKSFCKNQGLSKKQLIAEVSAFQIALKAGTKKAPPKERFVITLDYAKSMFSHDFDTGFIDDGMHCTHCFGNCTTIDHPPHTYCAVKADTIYCTAHLTKDREAEIKAYNAGKLDLHARKEKRDAIRFNSSRTYLKARGYNAKELKSMATKRQLAVVKYKHNKDYFYDPISGVVLQRIGDDLKREFKTIGIDRRCDQNIRKLKPSNVVELKDTRITFAYESLNNDAKKILDLE